MLFLNGAPVRGFGALDYSCSGDGASEVCTADTDGERKRFVDLQRAVNRFVGAGLTRSISIDGVLGPETASAVRGLSPNLALLQYGAQIGGSLLKFISTHQDFVNANYLASHAAGITSELNAVAQAMKRPLVIAPTVVAVPLETAVRSAGGSALDVATAVAAGAQAPTGPRRWPWIVAGVAVLGVGSYLAWRLVRKRRHG